MSRVVVVGTGAAGSTAAREMAQSGAEVVILEAGRSFRPFMRNLGWTSPFRRMGLLFDVRILGLLFRHLKIRKSPEGLVLVRGYATGGCSSISYGCLVRATEGLEEIGLDLSPEFDELEEEIGPVKVPREEWRKVTQDLFDAAERLAFFPERMPKLVDLSRCVRCGLCGVGCKTGAKWDSRRFLGEAVASGASLHLKNPVSKILMEGDRASGVEVRVGAGVKRVEGDAVVLAAGGLGTASILQASGYSVPGRAWGDIVLTLGGRAPGANAHKEIPMTWYAKRTGYMLSPYIDWLSHFFHKPWRRIPIQDRVGLMIKLCDQSSGWLDEKNVLHKGVSEKDEMNFQKALSEAERLFREIGVKGELVAGLHSAGHWGGTVALCPEDVSSMHPSFLPKNVWVADLSLLPKSQGLPTMLTAAALGLRTARKMLRAS